MYCMFLIIIFFFSVSSFTRSLNSRLFNKKSLIRPSIIYATNINRLDISSESSNQLDIFRSASTAKNPLEFIDALQEASTTTGPGLQEMEAAIVMELLTPILSHIDNHSFIYCLHLINNIKPAKEYMQKHLKSQFLKRAIIASDELWKIHDLERLLNELSKIGFESKDLPQEIIFNFIKRIEYSDMSFASMASVLRLIGAISLKDHNTNTKTNSKEKEVEIESEFDVSNIIVNLIFDKMKPIHNDDPGNVVDFAGVSKSLWGMSRSNIKWNDVPEHVQRLVLHAFNEAADDVDFDNGATVRINSKDLCAALQALVAMEADLLSIDTYNSSFRRSIISLSSHQMSRMSRREIVNLCWALGNLGFKWSNHEVDDDSLRLKEQIMMHAKTIMHQMSPFDMESFVHAMAKMEVPVYDLEGGRLVLQALEKMILSSKGKLNIFFIYNILDAVIMMGVNYEKSPVLVKSLVSMSIEKLHSFLPIQYGSVLNALSRLNVRFATDDGTEDTSSSELILSQVETKRVIAVSARFLSKLPISSALNSIKGLERMRISYNLVVKEFKSKDDVKPSPSFKTSFESYWKKRVLNMHHIPFVEFMEIANSIGCEPASFSIVAKQKTRTRFDSLAGKSFWTVEEQKVINKRFYEIGIFV